MPTLLRQLRKKNRWFINAPLDWLEEGDVPADSLANLETKDNLLSVFQIDGDVEKNIKRIAAAFAGQSQKGANEEFECVIFDSAVLGEIGITYVKSEGETPDKEVNSWHYDLIELSAAKLADLAKHLLPNSEPHRILAKEVLSSLIESGANDMIDWEKVTMPKKERDKILNEIEKRKNIK